MTYKQPKETLVLHGREWDAKTLSISIGFDALRMSIGGKPSVFTPQEIALWFACLARAAKP